MRTKPLLLAAIALGALYVARITLAIAHEDVWQSWFLKERGILERAEAVVWVAAFALDFMLFAGAIRRRAAPAVVVWFGFLTCLAFFALGEEVSWGQYVFGIQPGAWMREHNVQQDITIHNLELSSFVGLAPTSTTGRLVEEALDLLPYLVCLALWVALPLAQRSFAFARLASLPMPSDGIVAFLAANLAAYLVVDRAIADAAELFELAIPATFLLAALESQWRDDTAPDVSQVREPGAAPGVASGVGTRLFRPRPVWRDGC